MKYLVALALTIAACHAALTAHTRVEMDDPYTWQLVLERNGQRFILDHNLTSDDCWEEMEVVKQTNRYVFCEQPDPKE